MWGRVCVDCFKLTAGQTYRHDQAIIQCEVLWQTTQDQAVIQTGSARYWESATLKIRSKVTPLPRFPIDQYYSPEFRVEMGGRNSSFSTFTSTLPLLGFSKIKSLCKISFLYFSLLILTVPPGVCVQLVKNFRTHFPPSLCFFLPSISISNIFNPDEH